MDYSVAIATLKQADPILATLITQIGGCSLTPDQDTDLFASLAETILHQQLSTKVAAIIHQRFLQLYPTTPFPSPVDVLQTSDDQLRSVGISRSKVSYLKDLAQKVVEGLPTLDELDELDDEAIINILTQVRGIGRWSVHMLLIFRMGRLNVLPVDDLGVRSAIQTLYNLTDLPRKQEIEMIGQLWQPYCSIASWYLWRSLDTKLSLV